MGRGVNVLWRRAARESVRLAGLGVALSACREPSTEMRVERRAPLPAGASTLTMEDSALWIGVPDALVAIDTAGRELRRVHTTGAAPRLLRRRGERLLVSDGARVLAVIVGDSTMATRRAARVEPVAVDPMGRWTYTTYAWGSVLGVDSALVTRWGWPDAGSRATALAVGALGDRVYVGLSEGREHGSAVQIREAWTGREMGEWEAPRDPRGIATSPDPRLLYLWDDEELTGLRHVAGGLLPTWRASLRSLGMDSIRAVRPSPDGARLAVIGLRGDAGRLAVLSASSGRDTARWNGTPPDAAWDARGRLLVPEGRELLWLR